MDYAPLTIAKKVGDKLTARIVDIQRSTANMTLRELRNACDKQSCHWLPCIFEYTETKAGDVKEISYRIVTDQPAEQVLKKTYHNGFATHVDLFECPTYIASYVAIGLGNCRIRKHLAARKAANIREFANLSDTELMSEIATLDELDSYSARPLVGCGSLNEKLRRELLLQEVWFRGSESHHSRLAAIQESRSFIADRDRKLALELAEAAKWRSTLGDLVYRLYVPDIFEHLSEERKLLITYRNQHGWDM